MGRVVARNLCGKSPLRAPLETLSFVAGFTQPKHEKRRVCKMTKAKFQRPEKARGGTKADNALDLRVYVAPANKEEGQGNLTIGIPVKKAKVSDVAKVIESALFGGE